MLHGFPKDCLVNRPQTLLSPLVVYWSKSAFRISLIYNYGSMHLNNFDCFVLRLKQSMCYIQKKSYLKNQMQCWDHYEDDHAGAVIATNLFTGTVFSFHENDILLAAIYMYLKMKVTITSSVHNSIYWNEERCCNKQTMYCWKANGFVTVTANAESSSNSSCSITRH